VLILNLTDIKVIKEHIEEIDGVLLDEKVIAINYYFQKCVGVIRID
jgi:hypothetical protein